MSQFVINGGRALHGEVTISGSKNAALPILAATLLTHQICVIKNVPDIEDIHTMLGMLRELGSEVDFKNHTVKIQNSKISNAKISRNFRVLGCKMRASVLLLGPLMARTGRAHLPYPGGCVLGARPIDTHTAVFANLGVKKMASREEEIIFRGRPRPADITLPEFSVTATENAVIAAVLSPGETVIRIAAIEPHVQDLCSFLKSMGANINGIGTHTLRVRGVKKLNGTTYSVTPDYLETGTFALAALATGGSVKIKRSAPHDLDAMWNLLREMKAPLEIGRDFVIIKKPRALVACKRLQTNVYPGFPTDLQPPFAVLLTQVQGQSRIHETLFEGRFKYFPDLMKMGARIETLNPHEAIIHGPVRLHGSEVKSWDIRAGAAMIVAALAAKGRTTVRDVHYIDRGYERLDEKLRALGADIERSQ